MSIDKLFGIPAAENVEARNRAEKERAALNKSFETATTLRNFERGRGEFSEKDGRTVWHRLFRLADQAENLAASSLQTGAPIDGRLRREMLSEANELDTEIKIFERTKNISLFLSENMSNLRTRLEQGEPVAILQAATYMRGFTRAIEHSTDLFLKPSDEAREN